MREYGKVSPQFWVGKTGRALRGQLEAQIVALYLMTSPHANMIGVFYCPLEYIAKETGLPIEGASKGLQCLIQADFCTYEADSEHVFVHNFAANQIGDELKPTDKRVQGVINELAKVPKGQCWQAFRARYAHPYSLPLPGQKPLEKVSPIEAPSKPHRSQEQEQEQEQKNTDTDVSVVGGDPPTPATTVRQLGLPCPKERIAERFAEALPMLPRVKLWPKAREAALRSRWGEMLREKHWKTADEGVRWFDEFFRHASKSDFLTGRRKASGAHAGWSADFDFLISPKGFTGVREGKYDNQEATA